MWMTGCVKGSFMVSTYIGSVQGMISFHAVTVSRVISAHSSPGNAAALMPQLLRVLGSLRCFLHGDIAAEFRYQEWRLCCRWVLGCLFLFVPIATSPFLDVTSMGGEPLAYAIQLRRS